MIKNVVIGVVVLLVIAGGIFLYMSRSTGLLIDGIGDSNELMPPALPE